MSIPEPEIPAENPLRRCPECSWRYEPWMSDGRVPIHFKDGIPVTPGVYCEGAGKDEIPA